jgi:hypothetical protein
VSDKRDSNQANSATRCVTRWISEDVSTNAQWREYAAAVWNATQAATPADRSEMAREKLVGELKRWVVDFNPLADKANMYADLLDESISEVSWGEVADYLLSSLEGYTLVGGAA